MPKSKVKIEEKKSKSVKKEEPKEEEKVLDPDLILTDEIVVAEVENEEDIIFFRKYPQRFEEVTIGKKIKETIKGKQFDYDQWLITNFGSKISQSIKEKYPTFDSLKSAKKEDLVPLKSVGSVTADKIVKLIKEV